MDTANLKQFRILYNKLDQILSEKTDLDRKVTFIQKFTRLLKTYPSLERLRPQMRRIHEMRNLLVHEEKAEEPIFIPTDYFLRRIEKDIDLITKPMTAFDIASRNVYGCDKEDLVIDVIKVMADKVYSHVPIFENKENQEGFLGTFSESSLVYLVGAQEENIRKRFCLEKRVKIKEILDILENPIRSSWAFVPANMDVYKVQQMFQIITFDNAKISKARLGVLYVTQNGKKEEKILGIITAWDLSKIGE